MLILSKAWFPLGDKLHRQSSSPEINVVGTIKDSSPNFRAMSNEYQKYSDEYQKVLLIFIAQAHGLTT